MVTSVIGLDPSLSKTGYCWVAGPPLRVLSSGTVSTLPEEAWPARLRALRMRLEDLLESALPRSTGGLIVVMESQVWSHGATYTAEGGVYGVLQVAIWEFLHRPSVLGAIECHFLSVNPQQVKKWLGARGKDEVLLQVYKRYLWEAKSHDEADAYALAMIGYAYCGLLDRASLTVPQIQVLEKLKQTGRPWDVRARRSKSTSKRKPL